ncbi:MULTISPECIES: hypothetical protein [unclassified Sphingopyxis]|uniref:hypothetical protein n=1 Tax=unclassified Sphingopyxis TaxID=2614943 RepID=UPI0007377268|nr:MULTISPECIES: hypothetical protein [unclassified Sphingopyxis]KTE42432.1 hypothetical protein ATE62_05275 [Sphingopyxis sp. HIX]KTE85439.1 hypothetical protein ATE72_04140 [Sphingopyxis sp. HXXIV]
MPKIYLSVAIVAASFCIATTAADAQAIKAPVPMRAFSAEEVAAVDMPDTAFEATPADVETYDKYFYFHRDGTNFDTAYNDISECDAVSSGINYYAGGDSYMSTYYATQYGMAGALGGAIGSAMADAIFGSAERRRIRRINMRNCMGFKGYDRYGMEKERWQAFHFEEGFGRVEDEKRTGYLMKQARVASGPKPKAEVLPK